MSKFLHDDDDKFWVEKGAYLCQKYFEGYLPYWYEFPFS